MNEYKHQPQTPTVLKVETTAERQYRLLGTPHFQVPDNARHIPIEQPILGDEFGPAGRTFLLPMKHNVIRFVHKLLTDEMTKMGIPWTAGYANEEAIAKAYEEFFES